MLSHFLERSATMVRALKNRGLVMICVAAMLFSGCAKKEQEQESQPAGQSQEQATAEPGAGQQATPTETTAGTPPTDYAQAEAKARQTLMEMNQGKDVEPVDRNELKALLPESVPNMNRTDASAERTEMMGVKMSNARGKYHVPDDPSTYMNITITDLGSLTGPARMGLAAWTTTQFHQENDEGYTKTTTYKGYKAIEEFKKMNNDAALRVLVADRFMVAVEGRNVPMDTVKSVAGKIDFGKLAALAKK